MLPLGIAGRMYVVSTINGVIFKIIIGGSLLFLKNGLQKGPEVLLLLSAMMTKTVW